MWLHRTVLPPGVWGQWFLPGSGCSHHAGRSKGESIYQQQGGPYRVDSMKYFFVKTIAYHINKKNVFVLDFASENIIKYQIIAFWNWANTDKADIICLFFKLHNKKHKMFDDLEAVLWFYRMIWRFCPSVGSCQGDPLSAWS